MLRLAEDQQCHLTGTAKPIFQASELSSAFGAMLAGSYDAGQHTRYQDEIGYIVVTLEEAVFLPPCHVPLGQCNVHLNSTGSGLTPL